MKVCILALGICAALPAAAAERVAVAAAHVTVYREAGRFAGWPANSGIWSWGNEILVGFRSGYFKAQETDHAFDRSRGETSLLARSLDGGNTWKTETPPLDSKAEPADIREPVDFTHPDFAMTFRFDSETGPGAPSRFFYSTDRGHNWKGPFKLPLFGQKGIDARTDYLVNGKHDCMIFLTARKPDGKEGRVFCARTRDGGKTWRFVAYIGEREPKLYSIMPSTVRLSGNRILTTIRRNEGVCWIDAFLSSDNGKTWGFLSRPAPDTGWGSPPAMVRLKEGGLVLAYGYRTTGYGIRGSEIRARASSDDGATWGREMVLRGGGGNWDIGYPRMVQRPDGALVTIYYFNDDAARERYIEAAIWYPGKN